MGLGTGQWGGGGGGGGRRRIEGKRVGKATGEGGLGQSVMRAFIAVRVSMRVSQAVLTQSGSWLIHLL